VGWAFHHWCEKKSTQSQIGV